MLALSSGCALCLEVRSEAGNLAQAQGVRKEQEVEKAAHRV